MRRTFAVSTARLRIMMEAFRGEMRRGLNGKPSSLRMLPAYVDRPTGRERGTFLALDLGGTNVRVLQVDLPGDGRLPVCAEDRFVLSRDKVTADGASSSGRWPCSSAGFSGSGDSPAGSPWASPFPSPSARRRSPAAS